MISEPPVQDEVVARESSAPEGPRPKLIWRNIIFFVITGLITLIAVPIYSVKHGFHPALGHLTLFYIIVTGLSITVGYHRLFAHASFKTHPVIERVLLFFAAASFEQSVLDWASQHREHHQYVDTMRDPYSIKRGFFYAHIGWLVFWDHTFNHDLVKDLQKRSYVMHQHKYFDLWALISGIIIPFVIGGIVSGDWLGAFLLPVCFRIVFVQHGTFLINSMCHTWGKANFDPTITAKDHWLVALLTNGEGYHSYHHRFPSDYRNGVRWYHWDPTKWFIAALGRLNLAWDIRKVSEFRILEARIKADQQRMQLTMPPVSESPKMQGIWTDIETRYQSIIHQLCEWEKSSKQGLSDFTKKNVSAAKRAFKQERRQWESLIKSSAKFAAQF